MCEGLHDSSIHIYTHTYIYTLESSCSKEDALREALHFMGLESHGAKLPLPPSSLKTLPLPVPDCLNDVATHLSQSGSPFVGLQLLTNQSGLCLFPMINPIKLHHVDSMKPHLTGSILGQLSGHNYPHQKDTIHPIGLNMSTQLHIPSGQRFEREEGQQV